jgi:hypothetical protein
MDGSILRNAIGAIAPVVVSVLSTSAGIISSSQAIAAQKKEIERRLNELYRSGREADYQQALKMYSDNQINELAKFFLIEDLKSAAIGAGLGLGAGFVVRRYVLG